MVCLIYSADQITSANIAEALKKMLGLEEAGVVDGMNSFENGSTRMLEVRGNITDAGFADSTVGKDCAVFLSMHSSSRGVAAFTVHAEGNWGDDAMLGGFPKRLSTATPVNMLSILNE